MMITIIIILFALLIGAFLWGAYYYDWHRAYKFDVEMSKARVKRIRALVGREDILYVYSVRERHGAFYVVMFDFETGCIPIKRFYDEDASYARRCAEELCDKLNEKI